MAHVVVGMFEIEMEVLMDENGVHINVTTSLWLLQPAYNGLVWPARPFLTKVGYSRPD